MNPIDSQLVRSGSFFLPSTSNSNHTQAVGDLPATASRLPGKQLHRRGTKEDSVPSNLRADALVVARESPRGVHTSDSTTQTRCTEDANHCGNDGSTSSSVACVAAATGGGAAADAAVASSLVRQREENDGSTSGVVALQDRA